MKKYAFLSIILSAIFWVGCKSTEISVQDSSPLAVLSIIGNTQVPWVEDTDETRGTGEPEAEGLLTSLANKFTDGANPENLTAIDRLDYAFDSVRSIFPEVTKISVLDKNDVIESETYKALHSSYFNTLAATKKATGFKDLTTTGAKTVSHTLAKLNAKSALILSFTFQKNIRSGTRSHGTVEGIVTMKAKLLNSKGKTILDKIYAVRTENALPISRGDYNRDSLVSDINDAIDSAVRLLAVTVADITKNSDDETLESVDDDFAASGATPTPITLKKRANSSRDTSESSNDDTAKAEEYARKLLELDIMTPEQISDVTKLPVSRIKELQAEKKE